MTRFNDYIEDLLGKVASSVEPTPEQKAGAKRSHEWLRAQLQTGQFANRIVDHYLSGSYKRQTAIQPLDDVDIIFVIDPRMFGETWWTTASPSKVLESFARAIRYRYDQSTVQIQRRSVGLVMHHLQIDVVPAIAHKQPNHILIPDRNTGEWIRSAPQIHTDVALSLNQRTNGLLKPLVKVLKAWNVRLPQTTRFKSFCIETMVMRLLLDQKVESLLDGCLYFFDLVGALGGRPILKWSSTVGISFGLFGGLSVPDLASTGSNVAASVDSARRDKFVDAAIRSRDLLLAAQSARTAESAVANAVKAMRIK